MIIGFTGTKGCGKDTAGAYLIKQWGFERRAFADPLKKSVAALFNIPFWEVDRHKLDDTVFATIGNKNEPTPPEELANMVDSVSVMLHTQMWSPISEYTFREFLQRYGTEAHRDVFGEDFWIDQTLPVGGYYAGRKIVLTDVRFQNEVDRIEKLGGHVCKITRPGPDEYDPHRSEQIDALKLGLSGYEIPNTGTMDDLYKQIDTMLDTYGTIYHEGV